MTRVILAEISGNSRRGPELTPYERGEIIAHWMDGKNVPEIHREMGIPESTIRSTITADSKRIQGRTIHRSGRKGSVEK